MAIVRTKRAGIEPAILRSALAAAMKELVR